MRVLHTADWHLGHALHDLPRDREHAAFLSWLLDTLEREAVDVLLVCGDVFDAGSPPASALTAWYEFLAAAHRRCPHLTVVVIAGNHDSPARLTAPAALLAGIRTHVIGTVPRDGASSLVVPLPDRDGRVRAIVAAVPYLRPGDLDDGNRDRTDSVRQLYATVLTDARRLRQPGQALLAMGHLHLLGAEPTPWSERRIAIGGVEAIGPGGFGDDVAYVALGHLHRAQRVGAEHVRYSGSPIPLAMGEADYAHQVLVIDLHDDRVSAIRTLRVPRLIEMIRVPRQHAEPLSSVLTQLAALPEYDSAADPDLRPYLEVRIRLEQPEPRLRAAIDQAMRDRHPRLVKITTETAGNRQSLAESAPAEALSELDPREVLQRRWQRDHSGAVPPAIAVAFDDLLREVAETTP